MNLLGFGNNKNSTSLSVIKDPFVKTKIKSIVIRYRDFWNRDEWQASGTVEFKNGSTSGSQDFTGETFDDVVMQVKAMIDNLK